MDQRAPLITGHEDILDRLADIALSAGPIAAQTDKYFTNTSRIVAANGDSQVTFAVFMRRRVVAALEPTIRLVKRFVPEALIRALLRGGRHRSLGKQDAGNHRLDGEAFGDRNAAAAEDRLSLRVRQQCL